MSDTTVDRELIEYLSGLRLPELVTTADGREMVRVSGGDVRYLPPFDTAPTLQVSTLGAVLDFLRGFGDDLDHPATTTVQTTLVHVEDVANVSVYSSLFGRRRQRERFVQASAFVSPTFSFGSWHSQEDAIVGLQQSFEAGVGDLPKVLEFVGALSTEAAIDESDDGISQTTRIKTGAYTRADGVEVPNPVKLAPFLTFPEIGNPELEYVFRLRRSSDGTPAVALFETANLRWKLDAIREIAGFLTPGDSDNWIVIA